jgi:hypothetical protein
LYFALILNSAGPNSYLSLLALVPWYLEDGSYLQMTEGCFVEGIWMLSAVGYRRWTVLEVSTFYITHNIGRKLISSKYKDLRIIAIQDRLHRLKTDTTMSLYCITVSYNFKTRYVKRHFYLNIEVLNIALSNVREYRMTNHWKMDKPEKLTI